MAEYIKCPHNALNGDVDLRGLHALAALAE